MTARLTGLTAAAAAACCAAAVEACPGDLDGDGTVGTPDFLALLGAWGPGGGPADIDGDGTVGTPDFLTLLGAWGPCPPPGPASSPPTIVVYNENYPDTDNTGVNDALEIAQHYIAARGLDPSALCAVQLPPGGYATPDELLQARDTIVQDCLCQFVSDDVQQTTGCNVANAGAIEAIRDASPITHMVLVRGIPWRLYDVPWKDQSESDKKAPSFAFYLSYLINHDEDIFGQPDEIRWLTYPLETDGALGHVPPLAAAKHRMLAYGYVEAMDKTRTLDLIDRTITAEQAGFTGNVFLEDATSFFFDLMSSTDPACLDYLVHEPFVFGDPANSWPSSLCRVASTGSQSANSNPGNIPGEPVGTTVPLVLDAGLLYGRVGDVNKFNAFDGFDTMINWRHADDGCVPLCRDMPTQQERDDCKASSTDYFGELNTDCVGVAPGFMAYQVSSFGTQYYGMSPPGWQLARASSAHKSMPIIAEGAAYTDGQFTDNRYAHYGVYDHLTPDPSTCGGGPCPSHFAVDLGSEFDIDDIFVGGQTHEHVLRIRYRYTHTAGLPTPELTLRLRYYFLGGGVSHGDTHVVTLGDTGGDWATLDQTFTIGPINNTTINRMKVRFWADAGVISGYLDVDGVELIDQVTKTNVMPVELGSFTAEVKEATEQGDWPANVIDRLGGIACWGTSSHHTTNASTTGGRFFGAFFGGRTLGEAISHANAVGSGGIVFADPLYRPSAAKIYADSFVPVYQADHLGDDGGYELWADTHDALQMKINVLHGTSNHDTTRWELATCPDLGIDACEGSWSVADSGAGATQGLSIGTYADYFDTGQDQTVSMRLRVWNEGREAEDLVNYAFFHYRAHLLPPCPGDGNDDGFVSELDENELLLYWGPEWVCQQACPQVEGFCIADLNQDGVVDVLDWFIVWNAQGPCVDPGDCPADVNGDGVVNQLDVDLVNLYWSSGAEICPLPYQDCPIDEGTGMCVYDLDLDGDVDEDDHLIMTGVYWGACPR